MLEFSESFKILQHSILWSMRFNYLSCSEKADAVKAFWCLLWKTLFSVTSLGAEMFSECFSCPELTSVENISAFLSLFGKAWLHKSQAAVTAAPRERPCHTYDWIMLGVVVVLVYRAVAQLDCCVHYNYCPTSVMQWSSAIYNKHSVCLWHQLLFYDMGLSSLSCVSSCSMWRAPDGAPLYLPAHTGVIVVSRGVWGSNVYSATCLSTVGATMCFPISYVFQLTEVCWQKVYTVNDSHFYLI